MRFFDRHYPGRVIEPASVYVSHVPARAPDDAERRRLAQHARTALEMIIDGRARDAATAKAYLDAAHSFIDLARKVASP